MILDVGAIPTSLGEIINFKYHLDLIKNQYDEIHIGFATGLWDSALHTNAPDWNIKKELWDKFLHEIGQLFFGQSPYVLVRTHTKWAGSIDAFVPTIGIQPQKVELSHLLCKGKSLDIGKYIVLTTKVRHVNKNILNSLIEEFWKVMINLSDNYKIVILGEREVEMRREYEQYSDEIFGIYDQIISNIPQDRILDLTVPALGETVSDLSKIQQDCLIMNEAEFVATFGVGGNFCLSTSVANMAIGFRGDNIPFGDIIFENRDYTNAIVTKDWSRFIGALRSYL